MRQPSLGIIHTSFTPQSVGQNSPLFVFRPELRSLPNSHIHDPDPFRRVLMSGWSDARFIPVVNSFMYAARSVLNMLQSPRVVGHLVPVLILE